VSRLGLEPARRGYRFVRKKAKRGWSHVLLAALRARNRLSSAPVLGQVPVVVSLTSYGDRVETAAFAVESIAAGRERPHRLVLWLDDRDRYQRRPVALRRLEARGLEVRLTDNWGPHTKYLPAIPLALADHLPLATADDDILYPRFWLTRLWAAAQRDPRSIHCHRASVVRIDGDRLAPYARWPHCRDTVASVARFATGVSGVWYPPAMLEALHQRSTEFLRYAARADDIWLHWVALRSGIPIRQVSTVPRHFPYIPGTQAQTLVQENVDGGGNDRLLASLYGPSDIATLTGALAEDDDRAAPSRRIAGAR